MMYSFARWKRVRVLVELDRNKKSTYGLNIIRRSGVLIFIIFQSGSYGFDRLVLVTGLICNLIRGLVLRKKWQQTRVWATDISIMHRNQHKAEPLLLFSCSMKATTSLVVHIDIFGDKGQYSSTKLIAYKSSETKNVCTNIRIANKVHVLT